MKYRSKPVVIEAWQWQGQTVSEWPEWLAKSLKAFRESGKVLWVNTLEGPLIATKGTWIIKGIEGELCPCKNSVFKAKYEEVE